MYIAMMLLVLEHAEQDGLDEFVGYPVVENRSKDPTDSGFEQHLGIGCRIHSTTHVMHN